MKISNLKVIIGSSVEDSWYSGMEGTVFYVEKSEKDYRVLDKENCGKIILGTDCFSLGV